ncbi:MAG: histidine triad nucleotide-binding protein [Thermodesulfovibrionia bacterium]
MGCVFCRIIDKDLSSRGVYEDERVYAFEDINPQAPVHILIVPKRHIPTILDASEDNNELIGHMFQVANIIAKKMGIDKRGFRLVMNCNHESGQTVYHIHLHLLGGRMMYWPPG